MSGTIHRSSSRSPLARLSIVGFVVFGCSVSSAQQLDTTATIGGRSVPTQVAVEFATIGSVTLPVQVLALDKGGAAGARTPSNQVASNQQVGDRNRTEIDQTGRTNSAAIQIRGDDNVGRITQSGSNNVGRGALTGTEILFDLQQNGLGNRADLNVNAPNGASVTVGQNGNNNTLTGSVPGGSTITVNQIGSGATADVSQFGATKSINVLQVRAR